MPPPLTGINEAPAVAGKIGKKQLREQDRMTFMPWTQALEVGIAEIDEQHRWLVEQTNALH